MAGPYAWNSVVIKGNGFINGIVYSPSARNEVFINTDMGGAYRWDEQGHKWVCLTDWAHYDDDAARCFGVETLAVDPTDAGRVYLAVGTYMSPTAVMRSADAGHTFSRTDVPFKSNGNGNGRNTGPRMIVDPNAPQTLYYGTRVDGLWKSTDRAVTWSRVDSFPTTGRQSRAGKDVGLIFVHADAASGTPGKPTPVLYVGVVDTQAGAPRVFRSTDAGATWAPLPGGQFAEADTFPQRMAVAPDGKTLYITYATSKEAAGPYGVAYGRIFKVTGPAGGEPQWSDVTPPATCSFSAITLDPKDPRTLYTSELGNYNPADRIWRSTDGAATWTAMNPNAHRDDSSAAYAWSSHVHWMGDFEIDPFDRDVGMFTTGYGLYRTTNLTAAEPTWAFFNDGFEQSACTELVSPASGPVHLISSIGDRDGYRHDDFSVSPLLGTHGQKQGLSRGSSSDISIAAANADWLVRTVNVAPFVQYSRDNAVTWNWMPQAPQGIKYGEQVAISADGRHVVWSPVGAPPQYARREGESWSKWSACKFDGGAVEEIKIVADAKMPNVFYAYKDGAFYRSVDGGGAWARPAGAAPKGFRWIRAAPGITGHLWAAGENTGLWHSTDGGTTWARVNEAVVKDAYVVGLGAAAPGKNYPTVFVGGYVNGGSGIFRSDDQGATWTEISDAEHQYGYLTVIQGDPRVFGRVYLGTNGRGIVYGDLRPAGTAQQ